MLQVKAIKLGYYGYKRRKPGVVFEIDKEKDFSEYWMEPVGWTPKPGGRRRAESKEEKIARLKAELKLLEGDKKPAAPVVQPPAPVEEPKAPESGDDTVI